jgi:toxin secretion/phage lysis holin
LTEIKLFFAAAATGITGFIGGFDSLMLALVCLLIIDYITGVLAAIYKKSKTGEGGLNSGIGLQGIIKKVMQLFLVGVAVLLDNVTGLSEPYIKSAVIYFLMANEGISILENVAAAGVPVPSFLTTVLDGLKEKGDKANGK